jgi:hypothetical protein
MFREARRRNALNRIRNVFIAVMLATTLLAAQSSPPNASPGNVVPDYSGMYTFLKEGEFVQLTVEEGRVTGFVSRYGEQESDQGAFLDQFFKEAKLDGKKLSFTTQTVHGVWYEFKGTIERGEGKNIGDEAYYALKGKLTQYTTGADKKTSAHSHEVVFKAFPQDLGGEPSKP